MKRTKEWKKKKGKREECEPEESMENWWVRKKEEGEREWESNGDRGIEEVEIEEGEIKGEIREGEMEEEGEIEEGEMEEVKSEKFLVGHWREIWWWK